MDDNDGLEQMDNIEDRLALMSIGESAYYLWIGAKLAGADAVDGITVLASWFVSNNLMMIAEDDPTEEDDDKTN